MSKNMSNTVINDRLIVNSIISEYEKQFKVSLRTTDRINHFAEYLRYNLKKNINLDTTSYVSYENAVTFQNKESYYADKKFIAQYLDGRVNDNSNELSYNIVSYELSTILETFDVNLYDLNTDNDIDSFCDEFIDNAAQYLDFDESENLRVVAEQFINDGDFDFTTREGIGRYISWVKDYCESRIKE